MTKLREMLNRINERTNAQDIDLSGMNLADLSPKNWIVGNFNCSKNKLKTLEDAPKQSKDFDCSFNEIEELSNIMECDGTFNCSNNKLTTLERGPEKVTRDYICSHNKLKSFKGFPVKDKVNNIDASYNEIDSLEGLPKHITGNLNIQHNKRQFTEEEILAVCDVDGKIEL